MKDLDYWLKIGRDWRDTATLVLVIFIALICVFRAAACVEHGNEVRWQHYWENK